MRWSSIIILVLLMVSGCTESNKSKDYDELVKMVHEQNDRLTKLEIELNEVIDHTDALPNKYNWIIDSLAEIRIRQDDFEDQLSKSTMDEELSRLSSDIDFINNIVRNLSEYSSHNDGYLRIRDADSMYFEYDEVEWIDVNDYERIETMGLNIDEDFPNGFYLFNEVETYELIESNPDVMYYIFEDTDSHINVTYEEFIEEVKQHDPGLFCGVVFVDNRLVAIYETYLI